MHVFQLLETKYTVHALFMCCLYTIHDIHNHSIQKKKILKIKN